MVARMNVCGSKWTHPVILYKEKQIKKTSGNSLHSGSNCYVFPKKYKTTEVCKYLRRFNFHWP
jgi:hypothetical protein